MMNYKSNFWSDSADLISVQNIVKNYELRFLNNPANHIKSSRIFVIIGGDNGVNFQKGMSEINSMSATEVQKPVKERLITRAWKRILQALGR